MKQQLQKALVILMFLITGTVIVALALYMEFGDGIKGFWGIGGQGKGNEAETQVGGELTEASKTAEDNSNKMSMGIDVSKWQGIIDFEKVKESDIEFVMVRIGYRTAKDGVIEADGNAAYNLQKAQAAGLYLGAYFYSSAVSEEEAREEADFVADFVAKYPITYPIAYDCEGHKDADSRNFMLTTEKRTQIAIAFLDEIKAKGYTPMFYSSKGDMEGEDSWDMAKLEEHGMVWVAQYPEEPWPITKNSSYAGEHAMWQYSNRGNLGGMKTGADLNLAYFAFETAGVPKDLTLPEEALPSTDSEMVFTERQEKITAKVQTNLRSWPSTDIGGVVYTLENGEEAMRTGVSDKGWSRLEWQGQELYAITSYLTTDFSAQQGDGTTKVINMDGIEVKTVFDTNSDTVTAKELVNLRSLPSVAHESSRVIGTLEAGQKLRRTGINKDVGWSRLEYEGTTVYAITSFLEVCEE